MIIEEPSTPIFGEKENIISEGRVNHFQALNPAQFQVWEKVLKLQQLLAHSKTQNGGLSWQRTKN
jgi:hypothetical protein